MIPLLAGVGSRVYGGNDASPRPERDQHYVILVFQGIQYRY
jgi:hypothetical protein